MSLATRCPQCNSLFKVTSGQLQVHGGQVRCGHCKLVFSGIDHLTSADTEVWESIRLDDTSSNNTANPPNHLSNATSPAEFLSPIHTKAPLPLQALHHLSTAYKSTPPRWRYGMAALAVLIGLQSAWLARKPMVNILGWPNFQSSSGTVLRAFAVPASTALQIEGSGLKAMDEHTLQVDITLRNSAKLPSYWPVLKIELLDPQGLPLASKTISPAEYQLLSQETAQQAATAKPIAPFRTVEIQAYLNLKELHQQLPEAAATGFRLALFDTL